MPADRKKNADDARPTDPIDDAFAHTVLARYEELREQASGATGFGATGLGLGMFLREGMAGWVRAWRDMPAPVDHAPTQRATTSIDGSGAAVVSVLAAMALHQLEERSA